VLVQQLLLRALQLVGHGIERFGEHADLVGAPQAHLVRQIAGGDATHPVHQLVDGFGHGAGDERGADDAEEDEDPPIK
jgi:hypothetical protein